MSGADGVQTLEEALLLGFVKMKRPPSRCVVFDTEPQGVTAAHDVQCKAVGLVGKHAGYESKRLLDTYTYERRRTRTRISYRYELKHAEKRLFGFDEMTLMALREVFSDEAAR